MIKSALQLALVSGLALIAGAQHPQTVGQLRRASKFSVLTCLDRRVIEHRSDGSLRKLELPRDDPSLRNVSEVSAASRDHIALLSGNTLTIVNLKARSRPSVVAKIKVPADTFSVAISPFATKVAYSIGTSIDTQLLPAVRGDLVVVDLTTKNSQVVAKNVELVDGFCWGVDDSTLFVTASFDARGKRITGPLRREAMDPGATNVHLVRLDVSRGTSKKLGLGGFPIRALDNSGVYYRSDARKGDVNFWTQVGTSPKMHRIAQYGAHGPVVAVRSSNENVQLKIRYQMKERSAIFTYLLVARSGEILERITVKQSISSRYGVVSVPLYGSP